MALQTLFYDLNVLPSADRTFIRLSQAENGRQIVLSLKGEGSISIPSGATVTISGTKPDGVVYSASGSISGTAVTITEDTQMTAVAGNWEAKVKVTASGQTVATGRILFAIDADPVDPGSVPSDSELEGLVAEAEAYVEEARRLTEDIWHTYDLTALSNSEIDTIFA